MGKWFPVLVESLTVSAGPFVLFIILLDPKESRFLCNVGLHFDRICLPILCSSQASDRKDNEAVNA